MSSHAKAPSAGSTKRRAGRLGRIVRGAFATRGVPPRAAGIDARSHGRTTTSRLALLCLPALLLAAFFAPSATAAPTTIAESGGGAGEVANPVGTAVHQATGDLYVAERNNFRVSKFDSEGNFLLAFGYGVADGLTHEFQTCGPAASPPTTRCFPGVNAGFAEVGLSAQYVAVDQTPGDVYVTDSPKRVVKFDSSGELIHMVGKNVNKTKEEEGGATQEEKNICTAASGDVCGFGDSGAGPNEFEGFELALAVDAAGQVWIGDTSRLVELNPNGSPGGEIELAGAGDVTSLAMDSAGNFYAKSGSLTGIRKLEAGTGALIETLEEGNNPRTVTVDGDDNVFVGHCVVTQFNCPGNPYRFTVFDSAGEKFSQFGAGQVIGGPGRNGISVDAASGTLYAASSVVQAFPAPAPGPLPEDAHVEDLHPVSATLAATLNPEGDETEYHFEYGTSEAYGQSTPVETTAGSEFDPEEVEAEIAGLTPDTTYHFRLVATNECEPAEECTVATPDATFTTPTAVGIEAQWVTDVAAVSTVAHAELEPYGVEAQWRVEYGPTAAYGSSTPAADLEAGSGAVPVSATLTGLEPGSTYHYRFVAENEHSGAEYVTEGEDRTFTTQLSGLGLELADNRAWEMVTPPNKFGGKVEAPEAAQGGHQQAAAGGEALAYLSLGSIEADPEGNRLFESSSALARRGPGGVWNSVDITPPHASIAGVPIGSGLEYKVFSADLGGALLQQRDPGSLLSPEASERAPYLRINTEPPVYRPLVTGKEGFANVPPGTEFGGFPEGLSSDVTIAGATPDLSHVVLFAGGGVSLVEGVAGNALYVWEAGQLEPASVKPVGEGGTAVSGQPGAGDASVRQAISDDGSRFFWSVGGNNPSALYVRDLNRDETVRLDVVQPGGFGTGGANPVFQGASADGSVALFTDTRDLTADSGEDGRDLYRCDVAVEAEELGCELTNLTGGTADPFESAEAQGLVLGMSDDASRVYFLARGVLDAGPNPEGKSAVPGEPNLYLFEQGEGVRFIATGAIHNASVAAGQTSSASPSGRYLAFNSASRLTGYDNRDAASGEPAQEVFRYDAVSEELICVSCNPSGARPHALRPEQGAGALPKEFDPNWLFTGELVAAILPQATHTTTGGTVSFHRYRAVHDNGRVFFNAVDSLAPADSNGVGDVYQYEPTGLGDCTASSVGAAVSPTTGGCIALISSGSGDEGAAFLDAGVGGGDAFFFTDAQLSVNDEDGAVDVYDARVGGIAATRAPRAECRGEACQPAFVPPDDPTPASTAFRGAGNLRVQPNCGASARRAGRLSRRAKRARRAARRVSSSRRSRQLRRRSTRLAKRAGALSKRAQRCRRVNRRAGR